MSIDANLVERANTLLTTMTLEEKAGQLSQYFYFGGWSAQNELVESQLRAGQAGSLLFVADPREAAELTARQNLVAMKKGDLAFFYHSMGNTDIVGIAKVVKEAYQDPTTKETAWVTVDVAPHKALKKTVTLQQIKKEPTLEKMDLVRISRLSVQKVSESEFFKICEMGEVVP